MSGRIVVRGQGRRRLQRLCSLLIVLAIGALPGLPSVVGADCNGNGIPDEIDSEVRLTAQLTPSVFAAWSVAVADLDGNDFPDIIQCGDDLGWLRGLDGEGSFGPLEVIGPGGYQCKQILPADLDDDGDLDLLASVHHWPGSRVYRYDNLDGEGTFGGETVFVDYINVAVEIAAAATDVDGDGDLDVAWGWAGDGVQGKIWWRENLTDLGLPGVFHWDDRLISASEGFAWDVVAADVDGDDDNDLVAASTWFENTDDPFQRFARRDESIGFDSLSALDLDGDGDLDALDRQHWWENLDGLGDFGPAQDTVPAVGANKVLPFDIDGDGWEDLLSSDGLWYERLDGGVQFVFAQLFGDEGEAVTAADLDRDGDLDVVATAYELTTWYRNDTLDCNADGIPDECESLPDCDANGVPDTCELRTGAAVDECSISGSGNGVIDACEPDCDQDGMIDSCGAICPTCDADGDNCLDELDCSESDANAWSEPSAAGELVVSRDPLTTLDWQAGTWPGAAVVRYDLLRSLTPDDFHAATVCVETDDTDTTAEDTGEPDTGETFHYLVRAVNDCLGPGNLGEGSGGAVRSGVSCSEP